MSAMLEFRSGGGRVSQDQFFENLKNQAIEAGMKQLEQRAHAAAASIVDPVRGKLRETTKYGISQIRPWSFEVFRGA
jgi:hypothetical protein